VGLSLTPIAYVSASPPPIPDGRFSRVRSGLFATQVAPRPWRRTLRRAIPPTGHQEPGAQSQEARPEGRAHRGISLASVQPKVDINPSWPRWEFFGSFKSSLLLPNTLQLSQIPAQASPFSRQVSLGPPSETECFLRGGTLLVAVYCQVLMANYSLNTSAQNLSLLIGRFFSKENRRNWRPLTSRI